MQFQSDPVEPTINPDSICKDFSALQSHQKSICRRYPHATASGMQGEFPLRPSTSGPQSATARRNIQLRAWMLS